MENAETRRRGGRREWESRFGVQVLLLFCVSSESLPFLMLTRRQSLQQLACGFGYLALTGLAARSQAALSTNPLIPRVPLFAAKAKRVIFIFMQGGPSHVDSFDYKPRLFRDDGEMRTFQDARSLAKTGKPANQRVMKPRWDFRQYGQSGQWVSDLFPEIGRHVDDLCFIK